MERSVPERLPSILGWRLIQREKPLTTYGREGLFHVSSLDVQAQGVR